jgi:hypothetical protein
MDRAADNHYPTSVTEVIAERPVAEIAAEDCVLFLWATVPMLPCRPNFGNTRCNVGAWVGFSFQFCISKVGRRLDFAS